MKIRCFLLFVCIAVTSAFTQNKNQQEIDSLLIVAKKTLSDTTRCSAYNIIADIYVYNNIEKGLFYANKGLQISQNIGWKKGEGLSYLNIGKHLISKGEYAEALKNLQLAETIFIGIKNEYLLGNTYNQLGILNANQSKFPESLDYFFKALDCFEKSDPKLAAKSVASMYQNIGNIYTATKSYDKALQNYDNAITSFSKIETGQIAAAMNMANKGLVYQQQELNEKALKELLAAEKILVALNSEDRYVFVQSWIGASYLALTDYKSSIDYSEKAFKIVEKMGDQDLLASTLQNLGYANIMMGNAENNSETVALGKKYLDDSNAIYSSLKNQEGLSKGNLYLSEYYGQKRDFEKSMEAFKTHTAYKDSIFNLNNKQSLQNLEDTRTIELNQKEIELNKISLEKKEIQKWYLVGGIFLLLVIGSLLYYQSRNRQKTNMELQLLNTELDEANKAKTRFFSILNHDLRAPVANLIIFLRFQKEGSKTLDEETTKRLLDHTMDGAENLLGAMEDILQWSKSQMENFKPQPKTVHLESIFKDIENHFKSESKVIFKYEIPAGLIMVTDENYLKTILRNLTANAINAMKETEKPTIIWQASQKQNATRLNITDNGPGAAKERFKALYDEKLIDGVNTGLGLHLVRDLAKAIDCSIEVKSTVGVGTEVCLEFKH